MPTTKLQPLPRRQNRSEALKKWGKDPVFGRNRGAGDQLSLFLQQQRDMLWEAYHLSQSYDRQVYDNTAILAILNTIDSYAAERTDKIVLPSHVTGALQSLGRWQGQIDEICSPKGTGHFIHLREAPFPLWIVEQTVRISASKAYRERDGRPFQLNFTGGCIDRAHVNSYLQSSSPGKGFTWNRIKPNFIDDDTVLIQPSVSALWHTFVRHTPRLREIPAHRLATPNGVMEVIRQLHLITMELGWLMSRQSSVEVSLTKEITRIEYRDRVVEVPKEVIKEIIREVPGPERIIEKRVEVPGPERRIYVPEEFPRITDAINYSHLPDLTNIVVVSKMPEPGRPESGEARMGTKHGVDLLFDQGTAPRLTDENRVMLAWLIRSSDLGAPSITARPVAIQALFRNGSSTFNFDLESHQINPINWHWGDLISGSAPAPNPAPKPPATPAPNPPATPAPNPAPKPNPPSKNGGVMPNGDVSLAFKRKISVWSTTNNDGPVAGWRNGGRDDAPFEGRSNGESGQGGGAAVVQGRYFRLDKWNQGWFLEPWRDYGNDPNNAARIGRNGNQNVAWAMRQDFRAFDGWGVFMEMNDNTVENPSAEVRNMSLWILEEGKDRYECVSFDPMSTGNWCEYFSPSMGRSIEPSAQIKVGPGARDLRTSSVGRVVKSNGPDGGVRYRVRTGWPYAVSHFAGASARNMRFDPNKIVNVVIAAEVRLAPGSENAKIGVHIGGDPKITGNGQQGDACHWYPGIGMTKVTHLTKDWEMIVYSPARDENGHARDVSHPNRVAAWSALADKILPLPERYPHQFSGTADSDTDHPPAPQDGPWNTNTDVRPPDTAPGYTITGMSISRPAANNQQTDARAV